MTWDQIIELHAAGMTIGGHTVTHPWLPRLSADGQSKEINTCLDVLEEKLGTKLKVFAYTYGGYNEDTLEILRGRGCRLAFTTTVGVSCYRDKPLEVNRLDTNDLPLSPQAEPNRWSREVGTKRT